MSEETACYICLSTKLIDKHHIDCLEGARSPETVLLCRRCHRTYHDLGVEWFEDEYLDKAIELENRRRAIFGLSPMTCQDVKRSDYWYKVHGITTTGKKEVKYDQKHTRREFVSDATDVGFQ